MLRDWIPCFPRVHVYSHLSNARVCYSEFAGVNNETNNKASAIAPFGIFLNILGMNYYYYYPYKFENETYLFMKRILNTTKVITIKLQSV